MSGAHSTSVRVGCLLTDESVRCPTGGGFEKTEWSIRLNDGWLTLPQLVRRRRIGDTAAEIEDEDDPHGACSDDHWSDRPAQV